MKKYKSKDNYFCEKCWKTYTEYWDGITFYGIKTKRYGFCDCGGKLLLD